MSIIIQAGTATKPEIIERTYSTAISSPDISVDAAHTAEEALHAYLSSILYTLWREQKHTQPDGSVSLSRENIPPKVETFRNIEDDAKYPESYIVGPDTVQEPFQNCYRTTGVEAAKLDGITLIDGTELSPMQVLEVIKLFNESVVDARKKKIIDNHGTKAIARKVRAARRTYVSAAKQAHGDAMATLTIAAATHDTAAQEHATFATAATQTALAAAAAQLEAATATLQSATTHLNAALAQFRKYAQN